MTDPIAAHLADMTPYYSDDHVTLWHGDCLDVLATLPNASVDSVVTDPPYSLTDRREQYCAGDVLRDAIIMDAQHADAEAIAVVELHVVVGVVRVGHEAVSSNRSGWSTSRVATSTTSTR